MTVGLVLSFTAVVLSAIALLLGAPSRGAIFTGASGASSADASSRSDEIDLLGRVSHELRTPLTSIHGVLGLVSNGATGQLPPEAAELLAIANENSERMLRLVNDLLEHRRNGATGVRLEPTVTALGPMMERAVRTLQPISNCKHVAVECVFENGSRERALMLDEGRCVQVLVNLLSNAVTASPVHGTVLLTARLTSTGPELIVDDEGSGIAEADRERVFDLYTCLGSSGRTGQGTGLGLAIARQIMDAHGGSILIDSSPSGGARFVLSFPASVVVGSESTDESTSIGAPWGALRAAG